MFVPLLLAPQKKAKAVFFFSFHPCEEERKRVIMMVRWTATAEEKFEGVKKVME